MLAYMPSPAGRQKETPGRPGQGKRTQPCMSMEKCSDTGPRARRA